MSDVTFRDKAFLRMQCLTLVLENGSRIDANNPMAKADEYFQFILDGKKGSIVEKKDTVKRKKPGPKPKQKVEKEDVSISSPFGSNGRQAVLIS